MHLVDDVYFIFAASLGRVAHLFHQRANVFNRVVGSRVQFMHVERGVFLEGHARGAHPTRLNVGRQVGAVDGFGQNTGTGGFAYAAGAAKQERLGQVLALDGVLQGGGDVLLPYHAAKSGGTVLPGRNDKVLHKTSYKVTPKTGRLKAHPKALVPSTCPFYPVETFRARPAFTRFHVPSRSIRGSVRVLRWKPVLSKSGADRN